LMTLALEAGADDIRDQGGAWEVLSAPEAHETVLQALDKAGIPTESAEIAMVPKNTVKLEGKNAQAMMKLYDILEEHEDVQNVYGNYEIDEEEMEASA
jgi:transcriptional/translational regulatory protein YebC/TACO1